MRCRCVLFEKCNAKTKKEKKVGGKSTQFVIKSQEIIDSALRVNQTKLKMKFIYFSIVLNTVVLEMNFTKK